MRASCRNLLPGSVPLLLPDVHECWQIRGFDVEGDGQGCLRRRAQALWDGWETRQGESLGEAASPSRQEP